MKIQEWDNIVLIEICGLENKRRQKGKDYKTEKVEFEMF